MTLFNFMFDDQSKSDTPASELRFDPVSQNWVVVATGRAKKPEQFIRAEKKTSEAVEEDACLFCDLSTQLPPKLLRGGSENWKIAVVPNKYPAFNCCFPLNEQEIGPYKKMNGLGFHEVVITRDHQKHIGQFTVAEVRDLVDVYQERYLDLMSEKFINYIAIFHNHGYEAGASIGHPHSQIIATPVIDSGLSDSLEGSEKYFHQHGRCVHCDMIAEDLKDGRRIIFENDKFVALCPFASKVAFEMRIYPKEHSAFFERLKDDEKTQFAEALSAAMKMLDAGLKNPPYNFFIHTAPCNGKEYEHYHWHWECFPKTSVWAGFELSTGIEISVIEPEKAAEFLKSKKGASLEQ